MRTTIDLEPDLYALAKSLAASEDCSLSAAVNRLLRTRVSSAVQDLNTGLPVSRGRRPVTAAEVAKLMDEDL